MGPLTHMLMLMRKNNDDEFARFRATHPNWGNGEYSRALFNSQLSSHPGGRMPDDNGGPIVLGDQPQAINWQNVTPDFVGPPQSGAPPMFYREPMQAGPSPPVSAGQLSMMLQRGR